jgi:hypothetical protein
MSVRILHGFRHTDDSENSEKPLGNSSKKEDGGAVPAPAARVNLLGVMGKAALRSEPPPTGTASKSDEL